MSIEIHLTNLELSKNLKEIGLKQESHYYWFKSKDNYRLVDESYCPIYCENYSAFLASELLMMLPAFVDTDNTYAGEMEEYELKIEKVDFIDTVSSYIISYENSFERLVYFEHENFAECLALMLLNIIEDRKST